LTFYEIIKDEGFDFMEKNIFPLALSVKNGKGTLPEGKEK